MFEFIFAGQPISSSRMSPRETGRQEIEMASDYETTSYSGNPSKPFKDALFPDMYGLILDYILLAYSLPVNYIQPFECGTDFMVLSVSCYSFGYGL